MANKPRIRIETTQGDLTIELWPDVAPNHVDNFKQLIHEGFYDGLTFHRIIPQFIVQAGCPMGDGSGGAGWTIPAEFSDLPHERGTVSMARRPNDLNSASSQFFICLGRDYCQHLDGQYTVMGQVVEGLDTVDRMSEVPLEDPTTGKPLDPPHIIHAFEVFGDEHHEPMEEQGASDASGETSAGGASESSVGKDAEGEKTDAERHTPPD